MSKRSVAVVGVLGIVCAFALTPHALAIPSPTVETATAISSTLSSATDENSVTDINSDTSSAHSGSADATDLNNANTNMETSTNANDVTGADTDHTEIDNANTNTGNANPYSTISDNTTSDNTTTETDIRLNASDNTRIAGTVFWDQDGNGQYTASTASTAHARQDAPIEGITIRLWQVDHTGAKLRNTPTAQTATDAQGTYSFDDLQPGYYVVDVERQSGTQTGAGVQTQATSYYNITNDVLRTRAYLASGTGIHTDTSGIITLVQHQQITNVDFGYQKSDPQVTVDKSMQHFECLTERCTINWDVTITNTGNQTIPLNGTIADRLSSAVSNVYTTMGSKPSIPRRTQFVDMKLGYDHGLALDKDGYIWSWGDNSSYEMGDGTTISRAAPTRITPDPSNPDLKFTYIEAGENHSFAVDGNGDLWGWGDNYNWRITPVDPNNKAMLNKDGAVNRQVNSSERYVKQPLKIDLKDLSGNPIKVKTVASRLYTTVIIDTHDKMWSWGWNWGRAAGALVYTSCDTPLSPVQWAAKAASGNTANDSSDPQATAEFTSKTFSKMLSGERHTMALATDGTVWNFGSNLWGALGKGLVGAGNSLPQKVLLPSKAIDIATGENSEYILMDDGSVYAAGRNDFGQLGRGYTTANAESDVNKAGGVDWSTNTFQVMPKVKAKKIWAADANFVYQDADTGDIYGLGANAAGQLSNSGSSSDLQPVLLLHGANDNAQVAISMMQGVIKNYDYAGNPVIYVPNLSGTERTALSDQQAFIKNFGKTSIIITDGNNNFYARGYNSVGQIGADNMGGSINNELVALPLPTDLVPAPNSDDTAQPIEPKRTTTLASGSIIQRDYGLTHELQPGDVVVLHMSGQAIRSNIKQHIANQAWFTSTITPYGTKDANGLVSQGVPHARQNQVTAPSTPDVNKLVTTLYDITGNSTCVTGTDMKYDVSAEHAFDTGMEDSCDQVGQIIPPYTTPTAPILGSIAGKVWRDSNRNNVYDAGEAGIAGVHVYLTDAQGTAINGYVETTDSNGNYTFANLSMGSYKIKFEPVYRSEFVQPNAGDADNSSVASDDATALGLSTMAITLSEQNPNAAGIDAGAKLAMPWLQNMPATGMGWWVYVLAAWAVVMFGGAWMVLRRQY